jgi:hypothetical protein
MSAVNLINENDDEREIASQAACAHFEKALPQLKVDQLCMLKRYCTE